VQERCPFLYVLNDLEPYTRAKITPISGGFLFGGVEEGAVIEISDHPYYNKLVLFVGITDKNHTGVHPWDQWG